MHQVVHGKSSQHGEGSLLFNCCLQVRKNKQVRREHVMAGYLRCGQAGCHIGALAQDRLHALAHGGILLAHLCGRPGLASCRCALRRAAALQRSPEPAVLCLGGLQTSPRLCLSDLCACKLCSSKSKLTQINCMCIKCAGDLTISERPSLLKDRRIG